MSDNATLVERLQDLASRLTRQVGDGWKTTNEAAARIAELEAALAQARTNAEVNRAHMWDEFQRGSKADARRVALEADKVHPALAIDMQEHREHAFQAGYDAGHARIAELEASQRGALVLTSDLYGRIAELEAERDKWQALAHLRGDHSVERAKTAITRVTQLEAERDKLRAALKLVRRTTQMHIEVVNAVDAALSDPSGE